MFFYDFNIHIMDFQPGEFHNVKEVHYNQHGFCFQRDRVFIVWVIAGTQFNQVMLFGWHHLYRIGMLHLARPGNGICYIKM
ncbi:hypothetical protein SLE2022_226030 [Rubroshorea leprosula]